MSRMPRIQIEDAMYYIMPTMDHGEPIFRDDEDYELYLELLTRYKNKHNFKLFAFSLTPNSINLLIEPSITATISQIMHVLNPSYTKYFNRKYKRAGHLFQERYRIVLIEKAPNLLKMTAYIHLRPKLLHLTDDISSYKYTSFSAYLTEERRKPGTEVLNGVQGDKLNMLHEVAYVLGCLKDKSYQQLVDETGAGEAEELNKALEKEKVIGSTNFRKEAAALVNSERQVPEAAGQPTPIEKPEALPQPAPIEKLDILPEPTRIEKLDVLPETTPVAIEKPDILPQPTPIEKPNILSQPAPIKKPDILPHPIPVRIPKAGSRLVSIIWTFAVTACLVILSLISSMSFTFINILRLKESAKQEIARKDTELQKTLDMGKTYETELASYKAIIERLQAEKQKSENELSKARLSPKLKSGAPLQQKRNKP